MKEDLNCSGIYQIKNIVNGKVYVGSAINFYKRFGYHKFLLSKNQHTNKHLQNAWIKYSKDNFIFEIMELSTKSNLIEREQYWLDFYMSYEPDKGYNIRIKAKNNVGLKYPPMKQETKDKLSEINKGKKHTKETKLKMSKAHSGKNNGFYGRKHTDETKLKISIAKKGQVLPTKGIKLTPTQLKKHIERNYRRKVIQFNRDTLNVIKIWNSIKDAQNDLHADQISACCRRKCKTVKNCFWRYNDEYQENKIKIIEELIALKNYKYIITQETRQKISKTLKKYNKCKKENG